MVENNCLMVMQTMADMQKDMVVIFNDEVPIVTNNAFNSFLVYRVVKNIDQTLVL